MTPYWLTVVGVIIPVALSSGLALEKSKRELRLLLFILTLPLCVFASLAFISPESTLSLWGYGVKSGDLLSLTVQYDQPNSGLGVIESVLQLDHPFAVLLGIVFLASAGLSLLSSLLDSSSQRVKTLAILASGTWLATSITYLLTHQTVPMVVQGGESAVRNFFKWSALDPQRVSKFVIPAEGWQYFSPQNGLFIFSIFSAVILLSVHMGLLSNTRSQQPEDEIKRLAKNWYHRFYTVGALLSTLGTLWLASSHGFSGIPSESIQWTVTLALACTSVMGLPATSKASIATLCLLALSFQVL